VESCTDFLPGQGAEFSVPNTMSDIVLKYPNWQEPYRAAVIETNPKLLKQKIAVAGQVAKLRFKELENRANRQEERVALTEVLSALKILEESASS
jgi:hypothetical protein